MSQAHRSSRDTSYDVPPQAVACRWVKLAELLARSARLLRQQTTPWTERHGLTESQFSLLCACLDTSPDGVRQSDLASALMVSPAHVSGTVESLRGRGLLEGRRDASDRRCQYWLLTPAGRTLLETVLEDLTDWATELDTRLGPRAIEDLERLLARLFPAVRLRCVASTGQEGVAS